MSISSDPRVYTAGVASYTYQPESRDFKELVESRKAVGTELEFEPAPSNQPTLPITATLYIMQRSHTCVLPKISLSPSGRSQAPLHSLTGDDVIGCMLQRCHLSTG